MLEVELVVPETKVTEVQEGKIPASWEARGIKYEDYSPTSSEDEDEDPKFGAGANTSKTFFVEFVPKKPLSQKQQDRIDERLGDEKVQEMINGWEVLPSSTSLNEDLLLPNGDPGWKEVFYKLYYVFNNVFVF